MKKPKEPSWRGSSIQTKTDLDKPGEKIDRDASVNRQRKPAEVCEQGRIKTRKSVEGISVSVKDKIMIDIGSSTGGFTDCALQNGAKLVIRCGCRL